MGKAMSSMGAYLCLAFVAAQFISYFNYTNLGTIIAVSGASILESANIGTILADDSLTFDEEKHEEKLKKSTRKAKRAAQGSPQKQKKKPRQYFTIDYDKNGLPQVSTLVDFDPYLLEFRYEELIRK